MLETQLQRSSGSAGLQEEIHCVVLTHSVKRWFVTRIRAAGVKRHRPERNGSETGSSLARPARFVQMRAAARQRPLFDSIRGRELWQFPGDRSPLPEPVTTLCPDRLVVKTHATTDRAAEQETVSRCGGRGGDGLRTPGSARTRGPGHTWFPMPTGWARSTRRAARSRNAEQRRRRSAGRRRRRDDRVPLTVGSTTGRRRRRPRRSGCGSR